MLSWREKIILSALTILFGVSLFTFAQGLYLESTLVVPSRGGSFTEGVVGSPRFLNPVYADANDADRDLVSLLYSGLLAYDAQGNLVPDLAAEQPEITEGGKTVTVRLKENVRWHDGAPFTADDVIFTVQTIQDPAYRSPVRANWIGVDVERVSDFMVRFHLLDPYAPFLEHLTLKILPFHVWKDIPQENFALSPFNLQPIGTGPYRLKKLDQTRSGIVQQIQLEAFGAYHNPGPFIESISFHFFATEEQLIKEANRGAVQSFALVQESIRNPAFIPHRFSLPRYFALFFNLDPPGDRKELKEKKAREALLLATDTQELVARVFNGGARVVHSPFLPGVFGFAEPNPSAPDANRALALLEQAGYSKQNGTIGKAQLTGEALTSDLERGGTGDAVRRLQECLARDPEVYPEGTINGSFGQLTQRAVIRFQEKYAAEVLAPLGLTKGTGKAGPLTRDKLNALCFTGRGETTPLRIVIATVDYSPIKDAAAELERQWEQFGLEVEVETFSPAALERDVVSPRAYQALLFGEVLGTIPDPYPFWHSTQGRAPGLNLSSYSNNKVDRLLEDARKEFDPVKRFELFAQAQDLLLADIPAIFLYDTDYTYYVSKEIRGIQATLIADSPQRFQGITEWYIKTKRVPK